MLNCLYAGMNHRPHPPIACIAVQSVHQKDTKWILPSHLSMLLGVGFVKGIVEMDYTEHFCAYRQSRHRCKATGRCTKTYPTVDSKPIAGSSSSTDKAKQSVLSGISTVGTFIG